MTVTHTILLKKIHNELTLMESQSASWAIMFNSYT